MIKFNEIDISVMLVLTLMSSFTSTLPLQYIYSICISDTFQEDFLRLFVLIKRNLMISN